MTLVWFFDKTKKGSAPEKFRHSEHWECYSDLNQLALNKAFEEGKTKLQIMKDKWGIMVPVDLQKMEQYDDSNTVRYMKCTHPSRRLFRGWDEENPRDYRDPFDTLD